MMNISIEKLEMFIRDLNQAEYIFGVAWLLFVIFIVYSYSLRKQKKIIQSRMKVFQKAFDSASDAILIFSEGYDVIYANKSMISLVDIDENFQYHGLKNMPHVKVSQDWVALDIFIEAQKNKLYDGAILAFNQSRLQVTNKNEVSINFSIDALWEEKRKYYIVTIQDLTEINTLLEDNYKHLLTHLPNQMKALQDIPVLFSKIHTENNKIALILLRFDNFTRLRSIIGYEQSNEILIKFAQQLRTMVNENYIKIYHTFDNHFLLTISNISSIDAVTDLIKKLQETVAEQYKMEDVRLHLTFSAGIAIYPESGPTRKLLDNTYKALEMAQNLGDGHISVYLSKKIDNKFNELKLLNDMKDSLAKSEFEVYYQPIVRASNEKVVAAEALIRWIHPELGFIPPDVFIGLMEKTGFIIQLGKFVLQEVLKQQKRWELFNFRTVEVSINVSMVEMATGEFVDYVNEQLQHHQVNPETIKFEITEGVAMINEAKTSKYFKQLKKLGVGLSLDDFGTGYTSFTYLKKFPADIIKIDKSLVDHIVKNDEDKRIVKAMIDLGHNLGMKIVVEGVETQEMVELLVSLGCDFMQGYYFAKPLQVFEFQKLLR